MKGAKNMIVLKKHVEDDLEYLDPVDVIDHLCPEKTEKIFMLAKACADVLNYYVENTPDAFGNAPFARLEGFLYGYLAGANMDLIKKDDVWDIVKGKRVILRVEKPKLPACYYEEVKENAKTRREVFGY